MPLLRRLGRAGSALLVLLLALTLLALGWNLTLRREATELGQAVGRARSEARLRQEQVRAAPDPMAEILRRAPRQDEVARMLFRLQDMAANHGMSLEDADYGYAPAPAPFSGKVQLRFNTTAGYEDMRRFLREVQKELPAVSLARLSVERKRIADPRAETSLEFAMYYRDEKP